MTACHCNACQLHAYQQQLRREIEEDEMERLDLETLTNAADLARRLRQTGNPRTDYWAERLERAAGELLIATIPDQAETETANT